MMIPLLTKPLRKGRNKSPMEIMQVYCSISHIYFDICGFRNNTPIPSAFSLWLYYEHSHVHLSTGYSRRGAVIALNALAHRMTFRLFEKQTKGRPFRLG